MKNFFIPKIKLRKPFLVLGILSLFFLIFQFSVITPIRVDNGVGLKFDWPDEVANYFWARELASNGRLAIPEVLNLVADGQIHPRSFNTNIAGDMVPGSFLGLIILFAFLAKIFGTGAIIYFTPFLMLGGVWAFYFLIRKVFASEKIALMSSSFLLFSAPWLYYSFESLLPNVPVISLFLVSISFLVYAKKDNYWMSIFSGFLGGLALAIRPAEFVWFGVVYLTILFFKRKELGFFDFLGFLFGGIAALVPSLIWQKEIYGSFLVSGYDKLPELAQQSSVLGKLLKQALIPFGIHPKLALQNFWHYFVLISPATIFLSLFGVFLYLKKWKMQTKISKIYFWLSIFVFAWLFNYYGSWLFEDLKTLSLNRLGASYVRYWLILFALCLPFAAIAIEKTVQIFRIKYLRIVVIIAIALLGLYQVSFFDPNNIFSVRKKVAKNRIMAGELLKEIPEEAIIITNRSDKIFFPERRVIETYGLRGNLENTKQVLKDNLPLYLHENGELKLQ